MQNTFDNYEEVLDKANIESMDVWTNNNKILF